ncbi:hypothetical protein, partial [Clostridium autoethanogenum]|uniref:hypothetical protein n=1 Tax=Clostridium autoethanogenum TaxID=84023 RepID=UPI001A9BA580
VLESNLKKEDYRERLENILSAKKDPMYPKRIKSIKYTSYIQFIDILKKNVDLSEKKKRNLKKINVKGKKIILKKKK